MKRSIAIAIAVIALAWFAGSALASRNTPVQHHCSPGATYTQGWPKAGPTFQCVPLDEFHGKPGMWEYVNTNSLRWREAIFNLPHGSQI